MMLTRHPSDPIDFFNYEPQIRVIFLAHSGIRDKRTAINPEKVFPVLRWAPMNDSSRNKGTGGHNIHTPDTGGTHVVTARR